MDYYHIKVDDRIAQTSSINLTKELIDQLAAQNIEGAQSLSSIRYYTNAIDTKTQGVDFVAIKPFSLWEGDSKLQLHLNYNNTEVANKAEALASGTITSQRIALLEKGLPKWRGNIAFTHHQGRYGGLVRLNYFDEFTEFHLDDESLEINPGSKLTLDVELEAELGKGFSFIVGADNLFDVYPDKNKYSGIAGAVYPNYSPFGFNGGFYYVKLRWKH